MDDHASAPELFPPPDISGWLTKLRAKLPTPLHLREPEHTKWRMPCAGCGTELRIQEAAALVPRGSIFEPVCFPCRDAAIPRRQGRPPQETERGGIT